MAELDKTNKNIPSIEEEVKSSLGKTRVEIEKEELDLKQRKLNNELKKIEAEEKNSAKILEENIQTATADYNLRVLQIKERSATLNKDIISKFGSYEAFEKEYESFSKNFLK